MKNLLKDVYYSLRGLARRPSYTAIAVITLALGIGANTAIFSGINAILLKSLPFKQPENLMMLYLVNPHSTEIGEESQPWSYPKYKVLREQNQSFESVAAFSKQDFALTDTDTPERLTVEVVSASYFPLLGVNAQLGRVFAADEDAKPKERPVVLIGRGLWQRRFGGDQNVIGKRISLNKTPLEVVGVMPDSFHGLSGVAEVWVPTMMAPALLSPDQLAEPFVHWHDVIGRLKPGTSRDQAQAEMKNIARALNETFPAPPGLESGDVNVVAMREAKVDPTIKKSFLILFAAVVLVLLIACVNSANLLLVRARLREKEIAIRLAIGASRGHVIRLILIESTILGVLGGLLGLLVAVLGIYLLNIIRPANNPAEWARNFQILDFNIAQFDARLLAFNFIVAFIAGLLFGLLPAVRASRPDVNSILKGVGSSASEGFGKLRRAGPLSALVVAEIALSFVLLVGAGLMLRSFQHMQQTSIGFDPKNVLTVKFDLSKVDPAGVNSFCEQLMSNVARLPDVRSSSVSRSIPLAANSGMTELMPLDGPPPAQPGSGPVVYYQVIGGEHFKTLGIPVMKGRTFTDRDRGGNPRVAIVNEKAARELWPGEDPIGKRVSLALGWGPNQSAEVVGVVGDVKYNSVEEPVKSDFYLPFQQNWQKPNYILVRTGGNPSSLVDAVRREVLSLNKDLPVYDVKTMEQRMADATSKTRLSTLLLGLFAGVALLLSVIGVYGVTSYAVSQQAKEFSIRMALGASPKNIFKLVLSRAALLTIIGIGFGLLAALTLTRILTSQLYGVSSTDLTTFLGASLLLAAASLLACYVPARRVTKLQPMVAFRNE